MVTHHQSNNGKILHKNKHSHEMSWFRSKSPSDLHCMTNLDLRITSCVESSNRQRIRSTANTKSGVALVGLHSTSKSVILQHATIHTGIHKHMHISIIIHTCLYINMHVYIYINTYTLYPSYTHACTNIRTHSNTHTLKHAHPHLKLHLEGVNRCMII